jgi:hypothetical protein
MEPRATGRAQAPTVALRDLLARLGALARHRGLAPEDLDDDAIGGNDAVPLGAVGRHRLVDGAAPGEDVENGSRDDVEIDRGRPRINAGADGDSDRRGGRRGPVDRRVMGMVFTPLRQKGCRPSAASAR